MLSVNRHIEVEFDVRYFQRYLSRRSKTAGSVLSNVSELVKFEPLDVTVVR